MNTKCTLEVFNRVTGFFRPVKDWNKGKKEEFKDRKHFDVEDKRLCQFCGIRKSVVIKNGQRVCNKCLEEGKPDLLSKGGY